MNLLPDVRKNVIIQLWEHYWQACPAVQKLTTFFSDIQWPLDHFALIDLPSPHSGISTLNQLFSPLGYLPQGRGYLADKQNEFMWLAPDNVLEKYAPQAGPQLVIADFHFDALTLPVQNILKKYCQTIRPFPWRDFHDYCGRAFHGEVAAVKILTQYIVDYCLQRRWPLPTRQDYYDIRAENELLAWVLVFGCQPSHFGLAIHHAFPEKSLAEFNHQVTTHLAIKLNDEGGEIKGSHATGIAQSGTQGQNILIELADGVLELPGTFVEFVWRYPLCNRPLYWQDYFTGLIGQQANRVIESVYNH